MDGNAHSESRPWKISLSSTPCALDALSYALLKKKVNYILDADVRSFFDNLDKGWMIRFIEHRVADPRVLRLIRNG